MDEKQTISEVEDAFEALNTDDGDASKIKEINILLLGETGVGKSTFINSFANYMKHEDFSSAEGDKLSVLVPSNFSIFDKNFKKHRIIIGTNDDSNECLEVGASGTQAVKTYIFNIIENEKRYKIRLIDTPGMGDPRGITQDNRNCEEILNCLGNLTELHAICMLFNPSNSKVTIFLKYCIHQIFCRLDKSASQNMAFLFTNTRGHNYTPGETYSSLEQVLAEVKDRSNVDIPLSIDNVFCFDNEAFRFLAAVRQGIEFKDGIKEANMESWRYSFKEVWRLISYIVGDDSHSSLTPHNPIHSVSINKARRMIMRLSQPLAEIVQLISDNIYELTKHTKELTEQNHTLEELVQKMHIPVINLRVFELDQPVTVCTDTKCATIYKIAEKNKYHYKQRCHNPCYLEEVPRETVGDPKLINCYCIDPNTQTCRECGCRYNVHMHIYYETETFHDRIIDKNVMQNVTTEKEAKQHKQILINKMSGQKKEYEREYDIIVKTAAQFADFLEQNAISPTNDSVSEYIKYLINREENMTEVYRSKGSIDSFKKLLKEYEEEKTLLKDVLVKSKGKYTALPPESIEKNVQELFALKNFGAKIKEMVSVKEVVLKKELAQTEFVVQNVYTFHNKLNRVRDLVKAAAHHVFGVLQA